MINHFTDEFKEQIIYRLEENTPRIARCLDELTDDEVWVRPNPALNSIGNLVLHLCGNIRQYAISSLGDIKDTRQRDNEFSATGGYTKAELLGKLAATVAEAVNIIRHTDEHRMLAIRAVQGFTLSGIGILIHVTEHYSYHTGQIAFYTKLVRNQDLGFYANTDLNIIND